MDLATDDQADGRGSDGPARIGGHARLGSTIIQALAQAKEAGVDPEFAFKLVDLQQKLP